MSRSTVRSVSIQTTLSALDSNFAGRQDSEGYDLSKKIHIHRRNRAYVWDKEMQSRCLDSILKGYYIPPIICSSKIENNKEVQEVMEGGNRITTFRRILAGRVRELTSEEIRNVESYPITQVIMYNLSPKQQREMFRRLNKNVKVSDGQLYAMSDDSPLVKEALSLLNDTDHPLRDAVTTLFFDTRDADCNGKKLLENAVALVSGALYGPRFITKSFNAQEEMVELIAPIERDTIVQILGSAFEVFRVADERKPMTDNRRRKGQFPVGKWLGAILYDLHMNPGASRLIQEKWATYIVKVRNNDVAAEEASRIAGAQNLNPDKLKRISVKVDHYLTDNQLLTDEQVRAIRHPIPTDEDLSESDDMEGSEE